MFASRSELSAIANALSAKAQRRHEKDRLSALETMVQSEVEVTSRAQATEEAAFLQRAMARGYAQRTIDTGIADIRTRYAQTAPDTYREAEDAAARRLRAATGGSSTRPAQATGRALTTQQAQTTRKAGIRNATSAPSRLLKNVAGGNTFSLAILLFVLIVLMQFAIVPIKSGDAKGTTRLKALSGVFGGQYEVVA